MADQHWMPRRLAISIILSLVSGVAFALPHYYKHVHKKPAPLVKMDNEEVHYRDAIDSGMVEVVTDAMTSNVYNRMQPYYRRENFNKGFYFGIGAGLEAGDVRFSTETYGASFGTEGALARLFGGYQWFYKDSGWFVSGELAGDYTSAKNQDLFRLTADEKWRQQNQRMSAGEYALLLGKRLPSQDEVWLRLGGSAMQLHHDSYTSGIGYVVGDFDKWMLGYVTEIGFESYVASHWSIQFAQGYRYYPQHTFEVGSYEDTGVSGLIGFAPSDHQARFAVNYHFSPSSGYKYFSSTVPMKGAYLGTHFGSDRIVSESKHTHQHFEKYAFTTSNSSVLAGLYGGYFMPMSDFSSGFLGKFGLGIEGVGQLSTQGSDYQHLNTIRSITAWNIGAMLSYQLVNNNHLYLKGGWGFLTLRSPFAPELLATGNPKVTQGIAWNRNVPVWIAAIGYETMVSRHVAVRSEIESSQTQLDTYTEGDFVDDYKSRVYAYKLGLSYRFSESK